MFVCSDTDYCSARRARGHAGPMAGREDLAELTGAARENHGENA
jgi:hypothetical protein